jgi:chromatin structure-remodeling complex subunit RSC9
MKFMFVAKPEGELTQVDFWNLYKDAFVPYQDRFQPLVASDVIKNVNVVFPQAQAMVLPGPPQKFVVRGVDRRKDVIANERFKCLWDRAQCSATAFASPGELYEHILQHLLEHDGPICPCLWTSCDYIPSAKRVLHAHILTHIPSTQPLHRDPSQDDTITLPSESFPYPTATPTTRPPPPLRKATVTYPRPLNDPLSSSLTALLCIRVLFRASFVSTDTAPRADADHFGFPGVVEESEEQDSPDIGNGTVALESEREGERRGRMAFVGVRRLMEAVRIKDETLMGWITEMVDAGLSGVN